DREDDPDAHRDTIVRLGLRYGLMSSATSYILVDERTADERTLIPAEQRRVPLAMIAGGMQTRDHSMRRGSISTYVGGYIWKVTVDGHPLASFKSITGLARKREVIEYEVGVELSTVKPTAHAIRRVTLSDPSDHDTSTVLGRWWHNITHGVEDRRLVRIELFETSISHPLSVWELEDCLPIAWTQGDASPEEIILKVLGPYRVSSWL
ncbi:MAG: phage tail protein, partial [Myxococcota bacterium]